MLVDARVEGRKFIIRCYSRNFGSMEGMKIVRLFGRFEWRNEWFRLEHEGGMPWYGIGIRSHPFDV